MHVILRWLSGLAVALAVTLNAAAVPVVSIGGFSDLEGTGTTNRFRFPVTLSETSDVIVSVNFAASNGTALAGLDFSNTVGSLNFAPGSLVLTALVRVATDTLFENNETFEVFIFAPTNAVLGTDVGLGTIINDDPAPVLTVGAVSATEGSGGSTFFSFPMTLNATTFLDVAFAFAVSNGTATAGADFVATNGVVLIPAGQTSAVVVVEITTDLLFENNETFTLNLFAASNVTFAASTVTGTIQNDDAPPVASIATNFAQAEGTGGNTTFLVPVVLSTSVQANVGVAFIATVGSADAGTDYLSTNGVLVIPAGSVTGFVAVAVVGDADFELTETFTLTISAPSNATIGNANAVVSILNDDTGANVSIADLSVNEGTGSTGTIQVVVSLSQSVIVPVSVNFATVADSAVAPGDYFATNGTLVIAAGQTSGVVNVRIVGDAILEAGESFFVTLSNPTNVAIVDGSATVTLINDDTNAPGSFIPGISVGDAQNYEGTGGTNRFAFVVSLNQTTDVDVATSYATSNGTAFAGADFTGITGSVLIAAGKLSSTVMVQIATDALYENNETFTLNLFAPISATNNDRTGLGTILDDDVAPVASIATNFAQVEGSAGANFFLLPVVLSTSVQANVSIEFAAAGGGSATDGDDFVLTNSVLVIPAGSATGFVRVTVFGDSTFESNETFIILLNTASNATLGDTESTATILNDDSGADFSFSDITMNEGSGGPTTLLVKVTISAPVIAPLSVNFATVPGTALAGSDYTATNGTLIFAPGQTNAFIGVRLNADTAFESDESFTLTLSNPTNGTIITPSATITLLNDDTAPFVSVGTGAQGEGNAGTVELLVPITLTAPSIFPISINYETSNGTALAGTDFVGATGTFEITAGTLATSIVITVNGDTDDEGDETFYVTISSPTNAVLGTNTAASIIVDDENPPTLSARGITNNEGTGGTTLFQIPVVLSTTMIVNVTVSFTTSNGTAIAGTDYTATNGTLFIPAGSRTGFVAVAVSGDSDFETAETFSIHLSAPINAVLAITNATSIIANDDTPPVVSIGNAARGEGTGDQVDMEFPLTLNVAVNAPVTVQFVTTNGTATSGPDFAGGTGSASIPAGFTNGTLVIAIFGDSIFEGNESFLVHLTSASNATIGTATATGTIQDDETPPTLAAATNATLTEGGGGGTTNLLIPVVLSSSFGNPATVQFQTLEGTATAGSDFLATNGTLVIPANTRTGFVTVVINRDNGLESNETFTVEFFAATNATLTATQTLVTILNDDTAPGLSISGVTLAEGTGGTTDFVFPVTLTAPIGSDITVEYVTSNGTASAATDYTGATGTLVLAAGETATSITITVTAEATPESTETFIVHLFAPTNAVLISPTATGTITDDDTVAPDMNIGSVTQNEGNAGTTFFQIPVTLSATAATNITVLFSTANGTALAGSDYTATNGTLTIPSGSRTGFVTVAISGDVAFEFADSFLLRLSNAANAILVSSQSVSTILNDDALPVLHAGSMSSSEGNVDSTDFLIPFTLSPAAGVDITFDVITSNITATAGTDYIGASGTVGISAGSTNTTIAITVFGDTTAEGDETFSINLLNPSNATIGTATSIATILDDEALPQLTIGDAGKNEGNAGTSLLQIPVVLSTNSALNVSVSFATSNSAALAGSDYIATNGTLVISAGTRTGFITVVISGDTTFETNETFTVNLFSPVAAAIADAQGIATITNDDTAPALTITDIAQPEGDAGTTDYIFTISLTTTAGVPVTVNFATSNGTATAATDYTANSGTLTIPAGDASANITVSANGDTALEASETFTLNLFTPTNATIADPLGLGTIQNDDGVPVLAITGVTQSEGNGGSTTFLFPVTLSATAGIPVTVGFITSNETATAGTDYTARTGTLTIAAGQTATSIAITVAADANFEPDETFTLNLYAPTNATLATNTALGTLLNDDALPTLAIGSVTQAEGNGGPYTLLLPVVLSTTIVNSVSVNFQTLENSALDGPDFTGTNGTLIIPAGTRTGFIAIVISGDLSFETNENFTVNLSAPTNANLALATGTVTLVNDDTIPTLSAQPYAQSESDSGTTTFPVPVTVSIPAGVPITVQFVTSNGTAIAGSDYTATNGTLLIPAGASGADVTVRVIGDTTFESSETFTLNLFAPTNATIATPTATVSIFNDDALPEITIADAAEFERGPGTNTTLLIPVLLSSAFTTNITVTFATSNGTAVAGSDYTATNGTLTLPAGSRTGLIAVVITGDALAEADEIFTLNLYNPSNATIADPSAQITILNDEGFPNISIANFARAEGTGGAPTNFFRIPVTLSFAIGATATVTYTVAPGTATEGADYTETNGTLHIAANTRTGFIAVAVTPDATYELTETFLVTLADPVNGTLTNADATVSILNDDPLPAATITGGSVNEPDFNSDTINFTVTLNATSEFDAVLGYATSNRSALAETDYLSSTGTLTFTAGETTSVITITINGDTAYESNETFTVNLYAPTNATIATPTATGTILNNDAAPDITLGNVSQLEGTGGTTTFLIPVDIFFAIELPVTVAYTTANDTALAGSDYTTRSGTLVIQPGDTSTSIAITVGADMDIESDETFTLEFSNPVNATLPNPTAFLTIQNDDSTLPDLAIADFAHLEGTGGGTTNFLIPVTLTFALGTTASVNYAVSAGTATSGTDFSPTNGTLYFPAGTRTGFITVAITPDTLYETNETITINLDTPITANLPNPSATATILNDDDAPAASILSASMDEPDLGTATLDFTVNLSAPSGFDTTLTYATSNRSALAETDYLSSTNTLTIIAGETTAVITITINGDTTYESNETFTVNLFAPTNATIATPTAIGTILNNDPTPEISIGDLAQLEGTGGTTTFLLSVNLNFPIGLPITVAYTTSDGNAFAGTDYTTRTGILIIAAGQTATSIAFTVTADAEIEGDESFNIQFTDPINATVPFNTATLTIQNDDFPPPTFLDYEDYASQIPTGALRGYTNDPDLDGYPNLLEYVTGGNPTNAGTQSHITITYTDEIPALRFTRTTYSTDATLIIESASTTTNNTEWTGIATNLLGSWGDSPNITETGDAPHMNVTLLDPAATTNRHLRLRITRP